MNLFGLSPIKPKKICVIGTGSYLGYCVSEALRNLHYEVIGFDICPPLDKWRKLADARKVTETNFEIPDCESTKYIKGGIYNMDALEEALRDDVDAVVYCLAYSVCSDSLFGEIESEKLIQGTKNVIEACSKNRISSLVFTSSEKVVFNGNRISGGDERLPYCPLSSVDNITRNLSVSEQLVLAANNRKLEGGKQLSCCVLRMPIALIPVCLGKTGCYQQNCNFCMDQCDTQNALVATLESKTEVPVSGLIDTLSYENAGHAHVKAVKKLLDENEYKTVAGQIYCINDGKAVRSSRVIKHLKKLHKPQIDDCPSCEPSWLLTYFLVPICNMLWYILFTSEDTSPPPKPVLNCFGVSHNYSIKKAKLELDYNPTMPLQYASKPRNGTNSAAKSSLKSLAIELKKIDLHNHQLIMVLKAAVATFAVACAITAIMLLVSLPVKIIYI